MREVLSKGKTLAGLLLGAGCPASIKVRTAPFIPDIAGITACVSENIVGTPVKDQYARVLEQLQADGNPTPNIEHILTHVRVLRQAAGTEGARNLTAAQLIALGSSISQIVSSATTRQ